jgi:hypothetical protein
MGRGKLDTRAIVEVPFPGGYLDNYSAFWTVDYHPANMRAVSVNFQPHRLPQLK